MNWSRPYTRLSPSCLWLGSTLKPRTPTTHHLGPLVTTQYSEQLIICFENLASFQTCFRGFKGTTLQSFKSNLLLTGMICLIWILDGERRRFTPSLVFDYILYIYTIYLYVCGAVQLFSRFYVFLFFCRSLPFLPIIFLSSVVDLGWIRTRDNWSLGTVCVNDDSGRR